MRSPFPRCILYVSVLVIFLLTPQILNKSLTIKLQVLTVDLERRHLNTNSDPLDSVEIGSTIIWWEVNTSLFFGGFASMGWNTCKWEMFCFRMTEYKINIYHGDCWHPIKKSSAAIWRDAFGGIVREIGFSLNAEGSL